MKELISLVAFVFCCYFFGWTGILSLLIILPFLGWGERHNGPLPTNGAKMTNYSRAHKLSEKSPEAFSLAQDLLVKISRGETRGCLDHLLSIDLELQKANLYPDVGERERLEMYFTEFQASFPNWPKEYKIINDTLSLR